jgi:DNA-binding Lrp family transcriptional regulator
MIIPIYLYSYICTVTINMQRNKTALISNVAGDKKYNNFDNDKTLISISQSKYNNIKMKPTDQNNVITTTDTNQNTQLSTNNDDSSKLVFLASNDLHDNDSKILSLLTEDNGSSYTFKGLMRRLNLHQQSLTRALKRLEDLGFIHTLDTGYALSNKGELMLSGNITDASKQTTKGYNFTRLLQTSLPIEVKARDIARSLTGRWFSTLRWVGLIENEIGSILEWVNDDNSFRIKMNMISNNIVVETNAYSYIEKVEALIGACKIFEHITKELQKNAQYVNTYNSNTNHYLLNKYN